MVDDITANVGQMRSQGLPDTVIQNEMAKQGFPEPAVNQAISQMDMSQGVPPASPPPMPAPGQDPMSGRIEEIAESIIDEKWDELISEVKKIIDWKNSVEEKQTKLAYDLQKLKEDFASLHQGVLGKLEAYDNRMRDVSTELNAVGKVFKDTIPEFVENVKELGRLTK